MKDAQKPDHASLNTLISRMREGRFVIPNFQREFEWNPWDIRDLMRSIFSDYYIGSLLLWRAKSQNIKLLACEQLRGFTGKSAPEYIVLDGQQRLTAMYYAFLAPEIALPKRANRAIYFIRIDKFKAGATDEAFDYLWLQKTNRALIENRDSQFERHIFPLQVIGKGGFELYKWIDEYGKFWKTRADTAVGEKEKSAAEAHANHASEFGNDIREIVEQYQISHIELDKEIGIEKVCDIFTQINSKGVQLDVFDLLNALMIPKDIQLKHMYREARDRLSLIDIPKMNVYILQVMSILRQGYCSPKYLYFLQPEVLKPIRLPDGTRRQDMLVQNRNEFLSLWNQAVNAIEDVIGLLQSQQEYGVIGQDYLPYAAIVPAFAAINTLVAKQPSGRQLSARRKIRHWYWASVFLTRYSSAVESTSARDFMDMREWLDNDERVPGLIEEFARYYRDRDLRSEVKRGSSIYSAIVNLIVLAGARDWYTGAVPGYDDLDVHHIVPASWGRRNAIGTAINSILNRSLLSHDTRRRLGEKHPNEYLPNLSSEYGESMLLEILESHFINRTAYEILLRNPFSADDYREFSAERQRVIFDRIEDLLISESVNIPPNFHELNDAIEEIELGLRRIIVLVTGNDKEALPSHLRERPQHRVDSALRRDASLDREQFMDAKGLLEYFDLREIQDTIVSKALWERFADRFRSKETLTHKFSQLANLRNDIRHSRTVQEVARKEGEAAIAWFRKVLNL